MLKIQSGPFIEINTNQGYDPQGQAELQVTVEGGFELVNMQVDIQTLVNRVDELYYEQNNEKRMRDENPVLKDLYDKYKVYYELIKINDNDKNCGGG